MADDPLPFEKVSLEDAKKALDGSVEPPKKAEEQDWRWARRWSPPEPLKPATAKWLLALAPESRPVALPQAYPRIINRLCDVWLDADVAEKYFEELLNDRRGKRKGFPDPVLSELKALRVVYLATRANKGVWELEATRRR